MSRYTIAVLACFVGMVAALLIVGCGEERRQPETTPPPTPPPETSTPSAQADLQIVDVRVEKHDQPPFTHMLITRVRNNGAGVASGFNGGCTYRCAGGTVTSAGMDIVLGGSIQGNSEFTYRQPFRFQCEAAPPTVNLECTIDSHNNVSESNEGNNRFSASVTIQ